jgi:hypothetical protein
MTIDICLRTTCIVALVYNVSIANLTQSIGNDIGERQLLVHARCVNIFAPWFLKPFYLLNMICQQAYEFFLNVVLNETIFEIKFYTLFRLSEKVISIQLIQQKLPSVNPKL